MSEPTPMMARYLEVKAAHPGTLLLFRMGDFYELFYEDAEIAAKRLGITLTSRDKASANPVPMAGFPHHALRNHLSKLIRAGHRVAVCEQMEDPAQAKGMVRREVTQVVTPGTLTDDDLLEPDRSNFLAALHRPKGKGAKRRDVGLAWLDVSTGRFVAADLDPSDLSDELARINPAELLLAEGTPVPEAAERIGSLITERPAFAFAAKAAVKRLTKHFGTATLAGFDLDDAGRGVIAAAALLEYAGDTQKAALPHIAGLSPYRCDDCLRIDEATRRSLELTRTLRDGDRDGSLLAVLDETKSPLGARRLADWLAEPLTDAVAITARL
ncbi:MAG: DNA mismatch repair protein MutS, partial [Planctomycetota bacterium]